MRGVILILEDEFLIALHLAAVVEALGYQVVGPAGNLKQARELLAERPVDAAILDVNLGGTSSLPLAAALGQQGTPFLLMTGYDADGLPAALHDRPRLKKPIDERELARLLASLVLPRATAEAVA